MLVSINFLHFHLLQIIFSVIKSSFLVLFLSLLLDMLGESILYLLYSKRNSTPSLSIAYSLSFVIFVSYYSYILHISIFSVFVLFILTGCFLILAKCFSIYKLISSKKATCFIAFSFPKENYLTIIVISTIFFLLNLITLHSNQVAPGVTGNNDIYFWSACADQLLGKFNFGNIIPNGLTIWNSNLAPDSFGTYITIGFTKVLLKPHSLAFETLPIFMGAITSWTGLIITDLVLLLFPLRKIYAVIVASLVLFGGFFHYIEYNFFASEILETFIFLCILYHNLNIYLKNKKLSLLSVSIQTFPLIALLLVVYQSGFFVFFCFVLLYITIISFNKLKTKKENFSQMKRIFLSLLLALVLSFFCYPRIAIYFFHQTLAVANVTGGWQLPLLNAIQLLSLPSPFSFQKMSSLSQTHTLFSAASLTITLAVMFYLIHTLLGRKISSRYIQTIFNSSIAFTVGLLLYFFAYLVKGEAYQVWKFSAYVIMPISFIPISVLVIWLKHFSTQTIEWWAFIFSIVCIIISSYTSSGISDLNILKSFETVSPQLKESETVILDLPPYRETMIAFNAFSKDHKLIPLHDSYIPKAMINTIVLNSDMKWITTQECIKTLPYIDAKIKKYINEYVVIRSPSVGSYFFGVAGGGCLLGNFLQVVSGLSGEEASGRWSDGKEVKLYFQIPNEFYGKNLTLKFNLAPFLPPGTLTQTVTTYVDAKQSSTVTFDHPSALVVFLNSNETKKTGVNLTFKISHPTMPNNINRNSQDYRLSGMLFSTMTVTVKN
jgi:hypothetical protein